MFNWIISYITLLSWDFLLKWYMLKQISCCAPRFSLLLTAKFHSLYFKESEILEMLKLESEILPPTPQPWVLV